VHAAPYIAEWIKDHIRQPLIIGPDEESSQWIAAIAGKIGCPFQALRKVRSGDKEVKESLPVLSAYKDYTPVLVDDIISTAHTMIEAVKHLKEQGVTEPVCIGIHALFAGNAYEELVAAGAGRIITCNTIVHSTNAIDISHAVLPLI
jgi:ribose-phosphate pyrophosphokinase